MGNSYTENKDGKDWWCEVHHRLATYIRHNDPCCDPKLGGITIPCRAKDITQNLPEKITLTVEELKELSKTGQSHSNFFKIKPKE